MADIRDKIKTWLNKSQEDAAAAKQSASGQTPGQTPGQASGQTPGQASAPAQKTPDAKTPEPKAPEPEEPLDLTVTEPKASEPGSRRNAAMGRMTSAEKGTFLLQEQTDAEKKLAELTQ